MTKTQHGLSKISAILSSFILASNSPTTARSLGLKADPAVTQSASNINLMSGLYCPASPAHGPSSHNRKLKGALYVWSVSVCCCCLAHSRWWQSQGSGGRSNIRKCNESSRLVQQRHQHMIVNVLEEVMG